MQEKELTIGGMKCEHCAARVTSALESVPGVRNVNVSLEQGTATLEAGMVASDEKLIAAVEAAGFTANIAS